MTKNVWRLRHVALIALLLLSQVLSPAPVVAAGATTAVRAAKYAADGTTLLAEKTVDYRWMEDNLRVYGDGETHYYHQGPVFEGDSWDPDETTNLKDKGAVMGTAVKDLCDLVGGMAEGDEVVLIAVDNWHTTFAYGNVYEPPPGQGVIALCWFCGEEAGEGERFGTGYPANNAYASALQIVFMVEQPNQAGKRVFGNIDMKIALPQQEYQHFFEGQYPSTNGLSGKWISEVRIYSGGVPENADLTAVTGAPDVPAKRGGAPPWLPPALGLAGLALVGWYCYARRRPA